MGTLAGAVTKCQVCESASETVKGWALPSPPSPWARLRICQLLWVPGWLLSPQGADDLISPDALSTIREMDVANFRRVPRMPIYGTAQPSAKVTTPGARGLLVG